MAHRDFVTHPLVLRRLDVLAVREVTPRMRRITLGGPEFDAFERDGLTLGAFHAPMFDDHVKAIFADESELPDVLPIQLAHGIEWTAAPARVARDYTPRRVDHERGEVDLDFVLHGHGPAATWARGAARGDALWVVGPKSSLVLPERLDWIVLIGDETALPAIGRFLDERPTPAPARIVVTVSHPRARQDLALAEGDTIEWVVADPTDRAPLERAARQAIPEDGDGFFWAAAESRTLLPIRRLVSRELGLPKQRVNITGYWHAEHSDDQASPEIPSPVAWFTVRAALRSGILDDLADHPGATPGEIAGRRGLAAPAVSALMPTLVHYGMVVPSGLTDDGLAIGPAAEALLADERAREEFDGHDGDVMHALGALPEALASGRSAWEAARGRTLAEELEQDRALFAEHCEEAGILRFLAPALLRDAVWDGAERVLLAGAGAAELADLAREVGIGAELRLGGNETEVAVLAEASEHGVPDSGPELPHADLGIAAFALRNRTDAEARNLLQRLRARTDVLVVVDATSPDSLDPHAHEERVRAIGVNGSGMRDAEAIAGLGRKTGWIHERTVPLGWGVQAMILHGAH